MGYMKIRETVTYTVTKLKTTPVMGCYWQPYFKGYI
jgi:hypothetical protein